MTQHFYSSTSVATALSDALTSGATQFNVPSVAGDNGWPTSFPFTLAIDYGTANQELVDVTSKAGLLTLPSRQVWVVTRGVDGTTAVSHSAGATVQHVVAARDLTEASTLNYSAPYGLGVIAYNSTVAATTAVNATTPVELIGLTVTATLNVARQYRIRCQPVCGQSTVGADFLGLNLRQSAAGGAVTITSTLTCQSVLSCAAANAIKDTKNVEQWLDAPASGTYQFGVTYNRNSGSGAVDLNVNAFRPLVLTVEDMGPALGSTSP